MLTLDDPLWQTLRTSYSRPNKFLPVLRRLQESPELADQVASEFDSENYVCHQATVYETTVAVVPHFVRAASLLSPTQRRRILESAGTYCIFITGHRKCGIKEFDPPAVVWEYYRQSLQEGARLTAESLLIPMEDRELMLLMSALAGFLEQRHVGNTLYVASAWAFCPNCEAEFEPLVQWGEYY
jgi:hypothetical protein